MQWIPAGKGWSKRILVWYLPIEFLFPLPMGGWHMMKLVRLTTVALFVSAGTAAQAATITFDFESFATETNITGVDLGGVVITAGTYPVVTSGIRSPFSRRIRTEPFISPYPFRADFTIGSVSGVSVELGDRGGDSDILFLAAFDASDNVLDLDTALLQPGVVALLPLNVVSGTDIAYVLFGSSGGFPNSVLADNLTIVTTSPTPLPAALPLFLTMLAGIGGLRWWRRKVV